MKIGITTDCSSCIEYSQFKHNIKITRNTIYFGEKELIDGIDIKADEFYRYIEEHDIIPTTAAPKVGELNKRFEELKNEGYDKIIHFPISSGLSTYGPNMNAIKDELFPDYDVTFFPCLEVCSMQAYLAHYAEIMAKHNKTVDEIIEVCNQIQKQIKAYFIVDDLRYLVKNGRLTLVSGFVGQLMNIKPILYLNEEGKIVPFEKVRTKTKAIDHIINYVIEPNKHYQQGIYLVLHANREEEAQMILERIKQNTTNGIRYECIIIAPTIGSHIGSGLLGATFIPIDDLEFKDEI